MSYNALYTDLSGYYDLMCADVNYRAQSNSASRLHQIFGNRGKRHLDLACGTGPHIQHLCQLDYQSTGLDINQPMLDIAQQRCPTANFAQGNMCDFQTDEPMDLITCFLYSIHYTGDLDKLTGCINSAYEALQTGGVFVFNVVDKRHIDNAMFIQHSVEHDDSLFSFRSSWFYKGDGDKQTLNLSINKTAQEQEYQWHDEHPMVALSFDELEAMLIPHFDVHIFEHDYDTILPWQKTSGNAIFVCVKA